MAAATSATVMIKTLSGMTVVLSVNKNATVGDVKGALATKLDTTPDKITLILGGCVPTDDADYFVTMGHLTIMHAKVAL